MFRDLNGHHAADPTGAAQANRDLIAAAATMDVEELLGVLLCITTNALEYEKQHPNLLLLMNASATSIIGERLQTLTGATVDHAGCAAFLATLNRLGSAVSGVEPRGH